MDILCFYICIYCYFLSFTNALTWWILFIFSIMFLGELSFLFQDRRLSPRRPLQPTAPQASRISPRSSIPPMPEETLDGSNKPASSSERFDTLEEAGLFEPSSAGFVANGKTLLMRFYTLRSIYTRVSDYELIVSYPCIDTSQCIKAHYHSEIRHFSPFCSPPRYHPQLQIPLNRQ
jgi:hypothetical protein